MEGSKGNLNYDENSKKNGSNNLIKYIFIATTIIFVITTVVVLSLYIHEKNKRNYNRKRSL